MNTSDTTMFLESLAVHAQLAAAVYHSGPYGRGRKIEWLLPWSFAGERQLLMRREPSRLALQSARRSGETAEQQVSQQAPPRSHQPR